MNLIIRLILFFCDPTGLIRKLFFRPIVQIVLNVYERYRAITQDKVGTAKEVVLRLILISFAVVLIIWCAVFLYAAFYYTYMPAISHTRPVHMQFKTCPDTSAPCTFPHAHVSLTKKQQLLMVGQAYKVLLNIEMPESPQNQELGMFMVCGEMRDHESMLRGHSCRSAMLRYRSPLIRTITTWALSPLFVLGLKEEFQQVPVEIFSHYLEERHHPITDMYVEIQSQKIQFYTVTLHITADFTGLRYIMFNWPALSAVIGISTNLFFIMLVFLLSWYHWSDKSWLRTIQNKYNRLTHAIQSAAVAAGGGGGIENDENKKIVAVTSKAIESSASSSMVIDDEDLSFLDEKSFSSDGNDELGGNGGSGSGIAGSIEDLSFDNPNEEQMLRQRQLSKTKKNFSNS